MTAIAVATTISSGRMQLVNVRQRALMIAKWRVLLVLFAFVFAASIASAKIAWLGIGQQGPQNLPLDVALRPDRAEIVDRNGVPLARALPAYSLWFAAQEVDGKSPLIKSPQAIAAELKAIFPDEDEARMTAQLASGKPGYIRRRLMPEEANRVLALGEPALQFPRETKRYYPQGSMAAFVLGYVDRDGLGQLGMERVLNDRLLDPASRATPSMLSIDVRVQGALEDAVADAIRDSQAKGGAAVVLDVDTGEILGLASAPSFDPNRPVILGDDGQSLMHNIISSQVFELGSVFKPLTVAAAIDAGTITDLSRRYTAGSEMMIAGAEVHDHKNFGASLNVPEALIHSSNIVLAQVGEELGNARLSAALRSLGFFEAPYIELPGRGVPMLPRDKEWSLMTTTRLAYGHGMAVTPLHLACAYAALVNGGIWRPATLMKLAPGAAPAGRRVFKASTSARMRQLLRLIVDIGTGRSANAPGYRVGGKTGTAEVGDQFGYHKDRVVATFAAAFPMDNPRYVVIATMVEPKATAATHGQRTAAWNAAPIVGKVIPRIGPLLGILPDSTRDVDISDLAPLVASGEGE